MIPENRLSTTAFVSGFSFPVKSPGDQKIDWELGGVALNDPSQGLQVKVWVCEVVGDDITLTAPGIPRFTVFTAAGTTEVALSFDQNMNPFIAYMQSGTPKIYWYDQTVPGMTTTVLAAGCYDLRCTLDDKREFNTSGSDVILAYVRAGGLYFRQQRDRYTVEYLLKAGIGADASLVSMAMNTGNRLQFRLRNYQGTGALTEAEPYVAEIVEDLLSRGGVDRASVDVSELWETVEGYKVATEASAASMIGPLQEAFFFDPFEADRKIRFRKRGNGKSVVRITPEDFVEVDGGQALERERVQEIELLRKVNVIGTDSSIDYVENKQTAERIAIAVHATGEQTMQVPLTGLPDFFATIALRKIKTAWGEVISFKFGVSTEFSFLTPTDIIEIEDKKGRVFTARVMQIEEDSGWLMLECVEHAAFAYSAEGKGVFGEPPTSTTPGLVGNTVVHLVDIPVQRDQDDEFGYYVDAYGTGTGWSGGVLQLSIDDGATVYSETDVLPASVVGVTATDLLADISGEYFDDQVLRVEVDGTLESVSRDALLSYKNMLAVQRADGSWEVLQYQVATQVSDGVYDLSGLVRGRFATGATAIASSGAVVKIDTSLLFVRLQQFMYGLTLKYRAVSYGQDPDSVPWLAHSATAPQSQTEWAPVGVEAVRVGGNVTVTWIERPRLGVETAPRQSKYFAGYRVKYSDGATFDVTGTTHTRTGAPASQTITVCGLNTITGEGRQSEAVTV